MFNLQEMFNLLDKWRHYPNYQLERRADIFFAIYLRALLETQVKVPLDEIIIPELPVKRDLILPECPTNRSVKVDYVLFAKDKRTVYFVELKTDLASRREAQDTYLEQCKKIGFTAILNGLKEIFTHTNSKQKYFHLFFGLSQAGFLELPAKLEQAFYSNSGQSLSDLIGQIKVIDHKVEVEIFYIQPKCHSEHKNCIDFMAVSEFLEQFDDEMSKEFSYYLKRWQSRAGEHPPLLNQHGG